MSSGGVGWQAWVGPVGDQDALLHWSLSLPPGWACMQGAVLSLHRGKPGRRGEVTSVSQLLPSPCWKETAESPFSPWESKAVLPQGPGLPLLKCRLWRKSWYCPQKSLWAALGTASDRQGLLFLLWPSRDRQMVHCE